MAKTTKTSWLIPTNTKNLAMMLAQGLIADSSGFSKYYKDVLSLYPGYVPVFKDFIPSWALIKATEEASHLTPCVIKISFKHIDEGYGYYVEGAEQSIESDDAKEQSREQLFNVRKVDFSSLEDDGNSASEFLLVPAPLSLACIESVLFKDKTEVEKFKDDADKLTNNVSFNIIKFDNSASAQKIFNTDTIGQHERNSITELPEISIDYNKVYSFGGLAGLLFYFTKNGSESTKQFNSIFSPEELDEEISVDLKLIHSYFFPLKYLEDVPLKRLKIIGSPILDILVGTKERQGSDFKNKIVIFLSSEDRDDKSKSLAQFLEDYHRGKETKPSPEIIEELILKHKEKPTNSKIKLFLFMFFYKGSIERLMKYKHDSFEEHDYVLLAMLFGMKDKFIGLPRFLVEYEGLHLYISTLMANYAHKQAETCISFCEPAKPLTLPEMLNPKKMEFVNWAAKLIKIENCFESVMPNKEFTCVKGRSTYKGIVLPEYKMIDSEFFKIISGIGPEDLDYNKIRQKFTK